MLTPKIVAPVHADGPLPALVVRSTKDFEITGRGNHEAWDRAEWTPLRRRDNPNHDYTVRIKVLYSKTGLYVLMDATDQQLTASLTDFENLWTEDVFEVFLWTDTKYPVYFEYEISPLNQELPIIIPNFDGNFHGWLPWHYEGERRIKKAVSIVGGTSQTGARIRGWKAEIFFPYALLNPLRNVPPKAGSQWRANFYRVDHDGGKSTSWDWSRVGTSFHEYQKFGVLKFE
jgi:hypothetical protein